MGMNRPRCSISQLRRSGLTLVELLVVIGIIGLLIGILIPVIARAQAAHRSTTCLAALRHIGQAFNQYAQANRMTFPDPGTAGLSWEQLLSPYFNGRYQCPADEELFPSLGSSYDWRDTGDIDTSLAGVSQTAVKRPDVVLAFEALSGWHRKGMINVVRLDGAAMTMEEDACYADLELQIDPNIPRGSRK